MISSHSRVGMGTASTVARPWVRSRRQDGWTSPSMLPRRPSAMLMSLRYTGLRKSVVLVNLGSHVEKNEKTIFVKGGWKERPRYDGCATLLKFGNSWMKGLTCGLLSMGKGWKRMLQWPKSGFRTRTLFVVTDATENACHEPDIPARGTPEQDFWSTCTFGGSAEAVPS